MKKLFLSLAVFAVSCLSFNAGAANAGVEQTVNQGTHQVAQQRVDVYVFIFDDGTVIIVVVSR